MSNFLFINLFIFHFFLSLSCPVVKSSCHSDFLKCEHLCHEPPQGRAECRCRDGYTLQSDGVSCSGNTKKNTVSLTCAFGDVMWVTLRMEIDDGVSQVMRQSGVNTD